MHNPVSSPDGGLSVAGLDPRTQALLYRDGTQPTFDYLPDEAFDNLLVISTTALPNRIERSVRRRGADPSRIGVIPVTGSSVSYDGPLWVAKRTAPSDLTGISIRLSEALQHVRPGHGWVVFDNVTTLFMYARPDRVVRFLETVVDAVRERGARGVYVAVPGTLTPKNRERLEGVVDLTIER